MSVVLRRSVLKEVVKRYLAAEEFVFDVESVGPYRGDPRRNEVSWIALSTVGHTDVIPLQHPRGRLRVPGLTQRQEPRVKWWEGAEFHDPPEQLWPGEVFDVLKPLFFSHRRKIGHGVKFDLLSLAKYFGDVPSPPYGDTLIAGWILDVRKTVPKGLDAHVQRAFRLDYAATTRATHPQWRDRRFPLPGKRMREEVEMFPFGDVARYSHLDGKYTWLLWSKYMPLLEKKRLDGVFELEMDVLEVLGDVEQQGALLDIAKVEAMQAEIQDRLVGIKARIKKVAGHDINLNSNPQIQKLLYRDLKLPVKKLTKGTRKTPPVPSCDAEALGFHKKHPVVRDLLEFSEWSKILGTYIQAWMDRQVDGYVYTDFVQYGTETGRFSSRNPNLQNVPSRGDKAELIRSLFISPPGQRLIVADYSQIELRVLAHYCQDRRLLKIFEDLEADLHTETAKVLFDTSTPTKDQRSLAKNMNFLIAYGGGPAKLAASSGISLSRAKAFMGEHRRNFKGIYRWKDQVVREARRRRYVETLLRRRRMLPEINAADESVRWGAERQAVNTVVQGSAADLIKLAMVRVHEGRGPDSHIVLTIHDEIVVQVSQDTAEKRLDWVKKAMEGAYPQLRVPVLVSAKICDRWSDGK